MGVYEKTECKPKKGNSLFMEKKETSYLGFVTCILSYENDLQYYFHLESFKQGVHTLPVSTSALNLIFKLEQMSTL